MARRAIGGGLLASSVALAAAPHTVLPGETLWWISAANGLTTPTVAIYNGLPENAQLLAGTTIYVPTVEEGAAALVSGTPAGGAADEHRRRRSDRRHPHPPGAVLDDDHGARAGNGACSFPFGELHLIPAAAQAWDAMRAEASSVYGIDIYPGGPVSAYRTYAQQAELYRGVPRRVRGTSQPARHSSHEFGTAVDVPTQRCAG